MSHKLAKAQRAIDRGTATLKQTGVIIEHLVRDTRKLSQAKPVETTKVRRRSEKTRRKLKIYQAKQLLLGRAKKPHETLVWDPMRWLP